MQQGPYFCRSITLTQSLTLTRLLRSWSRKSIGKHGVSGQNLMSQVFAPQGRSLKLNQLMSDPDRDEQDGFRFLYMGAMTGIRNPKAHDVIKQNDPFPNIAISCFRRPLGAPD